MKKRIALGVFLAMALAASVTAVAMAIFTDLQQSSGVLSLAEAGDESVIYISDCGEGIDCFSSDDSGANEIIFEGDESLIPGSTSIWGISIQNRSGSPVDIPDFTAAAVFVEFLEVVDPSNSCSVLPDETWVEITTGPAFTGDDDTDLGRFSIFTNGYGIEGTGSPVIPHLEPFDFAFFHIRFSVPINVGPGCQGVEWSMVIHWTAVGH